MIISRIIVHNKLFTHLYLINLLISGCNIYIRWWRKYRLIHFDLIDLLWGQQFISLRIWLMRAIASYLVVDCVSFMAVASSPTNHLRRSNNKPSAVIDAHTHTHTHTHTLTHSHTRTKVYLTFIDVFLLSIRPSFF